MQEPLKMQDRENSDLLKELENLTELENTLNDWRRGVVKSEKVGWTKSHSRTYAS